jgi:hypothetical protein
LEESINRQTGIHASSSWRSLSLLALMLRWMVSSLGETGRENESARPLFQLRLRSQHEGPSKADSQGPNRDSACDVLIDKAPQFPDRTTYS